MPQLRTNLKVNDLKILLIHDHRSTRSQIERQLNGLGFTKIDQAQGVIPAVELMQTKPYDIIITGWKMPNGTGVDLLKACRRDPAYENVAIVLTSTESDPTVINEMMQEGATGYIVRPWTESDFTDQMEKILDWIERRKAI